MENSKKDDTIYFQGCDTKHLACKNCKNVGILAKPESCGCMEFHMKPYDVYYEGKPCPKFVPIKKVDN